MFNESLFQQFKQLLDQTFGENFFAFDLIKTNSDLKRYPRLARLDKSLTEWTSQFCLPSFNIGGQLYTLDEDQHLPIMEEDVCSPHESYFACVLKPINPPLGTAYLVVVSKKGSTYNYKWADTHFEGSVTSDTLKGLLHIAPYTYSSWGGGKVEKDSNLNLFLKLKPLISEGELPYYGDVPEETVSDDKLLTTGDLNFLNSLKGYQNFNKHTKASINRMREIGNRFHKNSYPYLYRALVNEIFYHELEESFQTSCSPKEEHLLSKDISFEAKKYFKALVSGVKSWTFDRSIADKYRYPDDADGIYGGSIFLIWVRPSKDDIVIDVKSTIDYIQRNSPPSRLKGTIRYWALNTEVLADPQSATIIGVKRVLRGNYCEYMIYLKS